MYRWDQRGAITIYLSIILLVLIILTGVIIDGARIRVAETHIIKTANSTALSVLSEYESDLKNYYGIFGVNLNEINDLDKTLLYYFNNSLNPQNLYPSNKYLDFFDYNIHSLKVNKAYSYTLLNTDLLEYQILEHMKYRGPVEMGEDFLNKIGLITRVGNTSRLLKRKIEVEEKLSETGELQILLHLEVNGPFDKKGNGLNIDGIEVQEIIKSVYNNSNYTVLLKDYYINKFNHDSRLASDAFNGYFNLIKELENNLLKEKAKLAEIADIQDEINNERNRLNKLEAEKEEDEEVDYSYLGGLEDTLSSLVAELTAIREDIINIKANIMSQFNEINFAIQQYTEINTISPKTIKSLMEQMANVKIENEKLLAEIERSEDVLDDVKERIKVEAENYKDLYDEEGDLAEIIELLSRNVAILRDFRNSIMDIDGTKITNMSIDELSNIDFNGIMSTISEIKSPYNNISFLAEIAESDNSNEYKSYDNRKEVTEKLREELEEEDKADILLSEAGDIALDLPSKNKEIEEVKLDNPDFTSKKSKTKFLMDALDFMINLPERMADLAIGVRDSVYVNEYTIGTFNNAVSQLTDKNVKTDPTLRHQPFSKYDREAYFSYEAEYVLQGNNSQRTNLTLTKGEILLYRFGLNLMHLYTNGEKLATATTVATAVAGWWTLGLGIPIAKTLILCGWSMAESILDLKDLMKGEMVPFFKLRGEWKLDIKNAIKNVIREGVKETTGHVIGSIADLIDQTHDYVDDKIDVWIDDAIALVLEKNNGVAKLDEKIQGGRNNQLQLEIYKKLQQLIKDGESIALDKISSIRQRIKVELSTQIYAFKALLKGEMEALSDKGVEAIQDRMDEIFKSNNIISDVGASSDYRLSILRFSYHDYLRIFLIFRGNEKKLKRIQDLIQVNLNTSIKELYCILELKADVSIRYIFLTQPFMAKALDFKRSRHVFSNVVVYKGY